MNAALWLLIGLQVRAWVRFFLRRLLTLRGALLAILGGTFFVLWILSVLFANKAHGPDAKLLVRAGPGALLLYCLLNVLLSSGERGIYFAPAEVNFLFSAPVSRRSLLGYKVVSSLIVSLPSSLVLSAISYGYSASFLTAFIGMLLLVLFMQLFTMAINLIAVTIGSQMYSLGRKLLVGLVVVVAALIAWEIIVRKASVRANPTTWPLGAWAGEAEATRVWQTITLPLTWFFKAFNAPHIWPDLLQYTALALLVNGVLLGIVFALDAQYMEAAAFASSRIYARVQRLRSGTGGAPPGPFRFTLPLPPSLGGVGTLCWRQLTTTVRMPGRLVIVLVMFVGVLGASSAMSQHDTAPLPIPLMAGCTVLLTTIFLTAMIPFDFRGDVNRIALLKTLPIPPWRLALGQVLTPVIVVSVLQWLVLAALYFSGTIDDSPQRGSLEHDPGTVLVICGLFALPINGLLFAVENLLFLLFPTRILANNPADFQALGRNVLFMLAKACLLGGVVMIAAMVGIVVGVFFPLLGLALAWLTITVFAAPLIPLIGWAFTIFDVGRDTPA